MLGVEQARKRPNQSLAQLERDAAFARIGRARRWLIVGAAAGTAAIAAVVSAIAPGRSLGARSHLRTAGSAQPAAPSSSARMPPLASGSQLGLQGPSEAPQPGQSAAPSDSGSSGSQSAPSQAAPAQSAPQAAAPQPAAPAPVSGGS